ncbi:MAG TPA: hypothetical protein VE569_11100, partial [Acidimicrobiia bacterium]|nr:hypothetical protein [Acidimicrobiia bacterium]
MGGVALVHLLMAAGLRKGELVWSGQRIRRLHPALRWRSFFFAIAVLAAAAVLIFVTGLAESPIPTRWERSATFVAGAFFGLTFLYCVFAGSVLERAVFSLIMLLGAGLAGWLTFG